MRAHRGLAVVGLVVLFGACGAPASQSAPPGASETANTASPVPSSLAAATVSPTDGPAPTIEPTFEPGETREPSRGTWAQDPPSPLLMGTAVRVLVPELNLRERPWLGAKVTRLVKADSILIVSGASPFEADGYLWYNGYLQSATATGELPPLPIGFFFGVGEPISGWFAATKGSTAYVSRFEPRCPDIVKLANVAAMLPAERLACFDDRSIELEGTFGCAGCMVEISGRYEPSWLTYPAPDFLWQVWMDDVLPLRIRFAPSGPDRPTDGSIVRIQGHFRDEAAAKCSIATFYPWERLDGDPALHDLGPTVARQGCRQEFVVESYEVLGTDPAYSA